MPITTKIVHSARLQGEVHGWVPNNYPQTKWTEPLDSILAELDMDIKLAADGGESFTELPQDGFIQLFLNGEIPSWLKGSILARDEHARVRKFFHTKRNKWRTTDEAITRWVPGDCLILLLKKPS